MELLTILLIIFSNYLYLTTIDMSLNNGKGQVISKNQIKIQDALNAGKITACKHGNGRELGGCFVIKHIRMFFIIY